MDIFFRADGNTEIGLGHLVRCLAMAQMLQSDYEIIFVCKEIPGTISDEIFRLKFSLKRINEESDFLEMLNANDIVVLDHYKLGTNFQRFIKKIGCQLVCIDDIHENGFYADLIVNHAPGIHPSDYDTQIYTQFALGLDYVLLRPVFLQKAKQLAKIRAIDTVLVCFGGSDSKNLTHDVVNILKYDQRFTQIHIIVGAAYENLETLNHSIASDSRFKLYSDIGSVEMADLISSVGLAIVPSSGILQEVLALQCKVISGMYAENQKNIFQKFKKLGAFESAERFAKEDLNYAIDSVLSKQGKLVEKFIDGKSGERILKYFKQLELSHKVFIRRMKEDDLETTFNWASNSEIRKFFFDKERVDHATHSQWFKKKMGDSMCFYYMGIFEDKEFGSIRFDVLEDIAVVSYLIDPSYQNKGLGTILLNKGLELFVKQSTRHVRIVQGEVLLENLASIRVFEKLGYDIVLDEVQKLVRFEKIIRY